MSWATFTPTCPEHPAHTTLRSLIHKRAQMSSFQTYFPTHLNWKRNRVTLTLAPNFGIMKLNKISSNSNVINLTLSNRRLSIECCCPIFSDECQNASIEGYWTLYVIKRGKRPIWTSFKLDKIFTASRPRRKQQSNAHTLRFKYTLVIR